MEFQMKGFDLGPPRTETLVVAEMCVCEGQTVVGFYFPCSFTDGGSVKVQ